MELDKNRFALAAVTTIGIVYIICGTFVTLWPDFSLQLFGWMIHLVNVDKFAGDVGVTLGGFIIGLAQIAVYGYATAYLFAWLHNKFSVHKI